MSEEWFTFKLAPDGDVEDGCHPEEAEALEVFLRQKTTATEAANAITLPIVSADNPREDLVRLWAFIMDALVELPSEHIQSLVELIKAIESLPEPNFAAIEDSNLPSETLWKGLPGFGHLWSDSYQSGGWRKTARGTDSPQRDTLRNEHIRKAEIEARLYNAGLAGIPIDWGYEAVSDALENRTALLDFEVPVATEWLVLCSHRFQQGAEKGEDSWALKKRRTKSSGALSQDDQEAHTEIQWSQVMSVERWSLWDKRLQELEAESGIVQDAARRAREAMRETNYGSS
jgi:hypothetical protein